MEASTCQHVSPKSRLLFTFMDGPGFRKQSFAVEWWLRLSGEPFRWQSDPAAIRAMLGETGWECRAIRSSAENKDDPGIARGEWIVEALASEQGTRPTSNHHNRAGKQQADGACCPAHR